MGHTTGTRFSKIYVVSCVVYLLNIHTTIPIYYVILYYCKQPHLHAYTEYGTHYPHVDICVHRYCNEMVAEANDEMKKAVKVNNVIGKAFKRQANGNDSDVIADVHATAETLSGHMSKIKKLVANMAVTLKRPSE